MNQENAMSIRPLALVLALGCVLAACDNDRDRDTRGRDTAATQAGSAKAIEYPGSHGAKHCSDLPSSDDLKRWLRQVPTQGEVGGFAGGRYEWAAIVDREGTLCALAVSSDDPAASWPGSQAIAKAKAYTANAFSSDTTPMSTARLYTMSQPGHSLWGAAAGNPINPKCVSAPHDASGVGEVCGGTIAFGGGVPLYRGQTKVGGLGASGDTPCADHEIAKRLRSAAKLDPEKGAAADDITYSSVDGPSVYSHPLCMNTWRNGQKLGDEAPAAGY
jgi:uncharacterized protein GlcG (DUF336 family)